MNVLKRAPVLLLLILFVPSLCNTAQGQEERGTVKAESQPVFAEMSKDSDVVATLPRGKVVHIAMTATNGSGSWCSAVDLESSEKLGFIPCNDLELQNAPSNGAAPMGSSSPVIFDSATSNQAPSSDQKRWALAAGAILSTFNHEPLDRLATGGGTEGTRRMIRDWWGIAGRDDLLKALDWIDAEGHRRLFAELGARTASLSQEELADAVKHFDPDSANKVLVAHRYYGKYASESITAWDYARYINVCRWGVAAGYMSEEDAWPRVMHAAQILQKTFPSWKEFAENYLVGREFWSVNQEKIDGKQMRAIAEGLLNRPSSVWNRIPWDFSLQASNAAQPSVLNLPPDPEGAIAGNPCSALHTAAASGESSDVDAVLHKTPSLVNCRVARGWTPLANAAYYGQTGVIRVLLAHGANVDERMDDGETPLHTAARRGNFEAASLLLDTGAAVNARDLQGATPLHYAAAVGHVRMTELLIERGANLKVRTILGCTPLKGAIDAHQPATANVILRHGGTQ